MLCTAPRYAPAMPPYFCTLAGIRTRSHTSPVLVEPSDASDSRFSLMLSCFLSSRPGLFITVADGWLCLLANRITCGSPQLVWIPMRVKLNNIVRACV